MPEIELTAQCWGGPEHGNLLSSAAKEWRYVQESKMWLNGAGKPPHITRVEGKYKYEKSPIPDYYVWRWYGPGADGETMERLRSRGN